MGINNSSRHLRSGGILVIILMKILLVGGTFAAERNEDSTFGKSSGLIHKLAEAIKSYNKFHQGFETIDVYNGGNYDDLAEHLANTPNYDVVFWFANVSNDMPKIRDVKSIAPKTLLVTSKRNDNNKYSFQELIQRALASKSNLVFEFSKLPVNTEDRTQLYNICSTNEYKNVVDKLDKPVFNIRIFDPLGCEWYCGADIMVAVTSALNRLYYLANITRQGTIQENSDKSELLESITDENMFVDIVHSYAERFHELMNPGCEVKRFLGNCSMRPSAPKEFRCLKGMPSFRHGDYIFVSQRNVDKEYLDISHFVPAKLENGKIYYCGENKPSVDTPIQLRFYNALPNINYMIHSHCYVDNAAFTTKPIPCGAIEEVAEVLDFIDKEYGSRELTSYRINLKGHGSIIMGHTVDDLVNVSYSKRPIPEKM